MENWLMAIFANITLTYILSRIIIYIDIRYIRHEQNDNLVISVCLFHNMVLYRMAVPVIKITNIGKTIWFESVVKSDGEKENSRTQREKRFTWNAFRLYLTHPERAKGVIRIFRHYTYLYRQFIRRFLSSLYCERFYWKTVFGTEDAAITGMMVGALCIIKELLITAMTYRVAFLQKPKISVLPAFGQQKIEMDFQCIFSIRLGNVIKAMSYLIYPQKRGVDHGRTSYSRANENCHGKHKRHG